MKYRPDVTAATLRYFANRQMDDSGIAARQRRQPGGRSPTTMTQWQEGPSAGTAISIGPSTVLSKRNISLRAPLSPSTVAR